MRIRDRVKDLRRVRAGDLRPSPRNWRTHPKAQQEALQGVLAEIGNADALIARELDDGALEIIDGHLRAQTTPEMLVPVLVLDVTAAEADKLLLSLDPLAAMAEADPLRLQALLSEVRTDNAALAAMLAGLGRTYGVEGAGGKVEQDDPPDPLPAAVSRPGDLWILPTPPTPITPITLTSPTAPPPPSGEEPRTDAQSAMALAGHRLLCGDATNAADVALVMHGARAALCATDPPYLVDYTGERPDHEGGNTGGKDWSGTYREIDIADAQTFFRGLFSHMLPVLSPHAAIYCWHAHKRQRLIAAVWEELGILDHQQIVWVKPTAVFGRVFWHFRHEPCMMGWVKGSIPPHDGEHGLNSVWEVDWEGKSRVIGNQHPTQKPVELFARPIRRHTQPGDVCYEPFSGSGTQIIACEQLGRTCCALEIQPVFVDVAVRRWQNLTGREAVLVREGAPLPAASSAAPPLTSAKRGKRRPERPRGDSCVGLTFAQLAHRRGVQLPGDGAAPRIGVPKVSAPKRGVCDGDDAARGHAGLSGPDLSGPDLAGPEEGA